MRYAVLFFLIITQVLSAQFPDPELNYYFPEQNFDASIPTPAEVIGHEVGEWHVTHDRLVRYMEVLADSSPKARLLDLGKTHEMRPLVALVITSEQNMAQLEEIRQRHLNMEVEEDDPVVLLQAYTIHGDEPSGSNAALLYAYYLLASETEELKRQLDDAIIIIQPCMNPDGMNRFASWVNTHKNLTLTSNNLDREYYQEWPRGRTNHYWFDLNRDWLMLTQPESLGKNELFHDWMPNILTDHHEMGKDATYFFQPGVPSRTHPLTPKINQELCAKIGEYHAKGLDGLGSIYYSEEDYDDFYYGKGSTFPDVQGCIGILFEQGSSRGHLQETDNGLLSFPFTIRNQLATSLSTLRAGVAMRKELLAYQRDYHKDRLSGGIVVGVDHDVARLYRLASLLESHDIAYNYQTGQDELMGRKVYHTLAVDYDQRNGHLARAMFDRRQEFEDSIFYDVSAFHTAQAFNLAWENRSSIAKSGQNTMPKPKGEFKDPNAGYGCIISWDSYEAPRTLGRLLRQSIRVKVLTKPITIDEDRFPAGSVFVPYQNQELDKIRSILTEAVASDMVYIKGLRSGSGQEYHLGSRSLKTLEEPKIALLVGNGTSPYDIGEVWYLMDQKYRYPVTKLDARSLKPRSLETFNTLVLCDGSVQISEKTSEYLKDWVSRGNLIIATESGNDWTIGNGLSKSEIMGPSIDSVHNVHYEHISQYKSARVTGGAIVEVEVDITHPLFYGYQDQTMTFFKRGNRYFKASHMNYKNVLNYSDNALLNGYMHSENQEFLSGQTGAQVTAVGEGRVINLMDNVNFRAFWLGTDKIMANAIFFGNTISADSCLR